jgi:hypothetical protein
MKIAHLLSGIGLALSNQEQEFIESHKSSISLTNLSEHDFWIAQNLVRKGVYEISKDNRTLIKKLDETSSQ